MVDFFVLPSRLRLWQLHDINCSRLLLLEKAVQLMIDITVQVFLQALLFGIIFFPSGIIIFITSVTFCLRADPVGVF